jgi:hypothetical protein
VQHNTVSVGQLITEWIWNLIIHLFAFAAAHPAVGWILKLGIGILLLIGLGRIVYDLTLRYAPSAVRRKRSGMDAGTDWWSTAQELASRDDFTGASHALYLSLVTSGARQGLVSLHESKTTGDYLREFHRKPNAVDFSRLAEFTRQYETVIYGIGTCDGNRFAMLNTLAGTILSSFRTSSTTRQHVHVTAGE